MPQCTGCKGAQVFIGNGWSSAGLVRWPYWLAHKGVNSVKPEGDGSGELVVVGTTTHTVDVQVLK